VGRREKITFSEMRAEPALPTGLCIAPRLHPATKSSGFTWPGRRNHGAMPEFARQKITFAEMRSAGVRGLLFYCSDYRCSHWTALSADKWPDDVSAVRREPLFNCQAATETEDWSDEPFPLLRHGRTEGRHSDGHALAYSR
jgi:hypothetical protein